MAHQRLNLEWIGKEQRHRLEPRVLLENPSVSYHATHRVSEHDLFDNRLIYGDNLLALKSLEQEFAGRIKCVYIDPPYNTGNGQSRISRWRGAFAMAFDDERAYRTAA